MTVLKLAMDRATVRTVDGFGRMYIEVSNISKACVNPYRGSEIPNAAGLGLDLDRVYYLLRDPGELALAAPSFNNIPLLDRHVPVSADAPSQEFVVGSTGTDAKFDEPFLRNSLVIWTANAIAGVRTKQQCELSSAYSYRADMTPGVHEGVPFDGIMRDIKGNHVALVEVGRAGPDVVVGDSKLLEIPKMKKLSANAARVRTGLTAALLPVLAQDAQIGDLTAIAGSVKSLKTAKAKTQLIDAVNAAYGDKLAQDATLDHLPKLVDMLAQDEADDLKVKANDSDELDEDGNPKVKANDEDDDVKAKDSDDDKVDKPAMDAALTKMRNETIAEMRAIQRAEAEVAPHIGTLAIAQDSAAAVYKLALDAAKIDTTGVHPSAYRAMVSMLPKAGDVRPATASAIAQDSANSATSFSTRFPNASKMKGGA